MYTWGVTTGVIGLLVMLIQWWMEPIFQRQVKERHDLLQVARSHAHIYKTEVEFAKYVNVVIGALKNVVPPTCKECVQKITELDRDNLDRGLADVSQSTTNLSVIQKNASDVFVAMNAFYASIS